MYDLEFLRINQERVAAAAAALASIFLAQWGMYLRMHAAQQKTEKLNVYCNNDTYIIYRTKGNARTIVKR